MRNRIGYDTYDTYGRSTNKNDREEKILTMLMSGGYNDDGYHFDEYEAKEVVEQMYHVKDNKKYIGEKYDMNKAHEICERYKEDYLMMLNLVMFMLQLMLNTMIMLNYLKNGLVVI